MSHESFSSLVKEHQKTLANSHVFMVDLIDAVWGALEIYRASSADTAGVTIRRGPDASDRSPHVDLSWHFSLPVRKGDKEDKSKWSCGPAVDKVQLCKEIEEFCRDHIPLSADTTEYEIGEEGKGSFGHRVRIKRDKNSYHLQHIFFARITNYSPEYLNYVFTIIQEDSSDLKKSSLRKHVGPYADFSLLTDYIKDNNKEQFLSEFNTIEVFARILDPSFKPLSDDAVKFWFLAVGLHRKITSNSFISPDLIHECWEHALRNNRRNTGLPWEYRGRDTSGIAPGPAGRPGARVPTFTLSLDLRKSTSLMDQVEQAGAFAIWLESLSEICRKIVHDNGGIFDKFTGDGVIAHFAATERDADERDNMIYDNALASPTIRAQAERAFTCSCELVRAIQEHLKQLRPLLRFDIGTAGPSVGLAFDDASWSLDRDGRPIVVGKGVVNACRLTGAPAGAIEMANNARRFVERMPNSQVLMPSIRINNVKNHKDLKDDILPRDFMCRIRANDASDPFPGRPRHILQKEVDRIFKDVEAMHRDRADMMKDALD